jgi:hypothetical protein
MRHGRVILLSTHFMEEADALSDRIVILSHGQIRVDEHTSVLKERYAGGYKLIVATNTNTDHEQLLERLAAALPDATLASRSDFQLVIESNEPVSGAFLHALAQLDELQTNKCIDNYAVGSTTLGCSRSVGVPCPSSEDASVLIVDDVYLRLTADADADADADGEGEDVDERCVQMFTERPVQGIYHFYVSQYEGVLIKSVRIVSRRWALFVLVCALSVLVESWLTPPTTNSTDEHLIETNAYDSLAGQSVVVGVPSTSDRPWPSPVPSVDVRQLSNLSDIDELDRLLSGARADQQHTRHGSSLCLARRQRDSNSYSNEPFGLLLQSGGRISLVTSHLMSADVPFAFATDYVCADRCSIATRLRLLSDARTRMEPHSVASLVRTLSVFGCFYSTLPGDATYVHYLSCQLIFFYISVLIIGEGKQLRGLLHIFGLHPIVHWTSRFVFDCLLSSVVRLLVFVVGACWSAAALPSSHLSRSVFAVNDLNDVRRRNSEQAEKNFYLFHWLVPVSTLPFVYLLTGESRLGVLVRGHDSSVRPQKSSGRISSAAC